MSNLNSFQQIQQAYIKNKCVTVVVGITCVVIPFAGGGTSGLLNI